MCRQAPNGFGLHGLRHVCIAKAVAVALIAGLPITMRAMRLSASKAKEQESPFADFSLADSANSWKL